MSSPYLKISINDGPFQKRNYDANLEVSDLDPEIYLLWSNSKLLFSINDSSNCHTRNTTLQELHVPPNSLLYVFNSSYTFNPSNMQNFVPANVRKIRAFAQAASNAFNNSKQRKIIQALLGLASGRTQVKVESIAHGLHILNNNPSLLQDEGIRLISTELFKHFQERHFDMFALDCPELIEEFKKNDKMDYEQFHKMCVEYKNDLVRKESLINDPTSKEGQLLLQRRINRNRIYDMYSQSLDHHPENQIPVTMLYINLSINGFPVKAFIDSGAQVSIMSEACAERCNLTDIIDRRMRGVARGVGGNERFVGQIHLCDVKVENAHFMCPFNVMANREMDLLIGLNVLKQHRCSINLAKNRLEFADGTSTTFLQSNEIENHLEQINAKPDEEEMDTTN